jgi:hypothetical protein
MSVFELTPSRRAKLIVHEILVYAEKGGMKPQDCGVAYDAICNCLESSGRNPDKSLGKMNRQIAEILNAAVWEM